MTSYIIFGQNSSKTNLFDPETGELIKIQFDPETGEVITSGVVKNDSLLKINTIDEKIINYREIKQMAKADAVEYFNETPWVFAGIGGCAPGIIVGPLGLGIPAAYGYFKEVEKISIPKDIPSDKINLYDQIFNKEIKRQRALATLKGHGFGLLTFIFLIMLLEG
tara:strand:+ start:371 stop:865 length:495 start_codon:yes stop_codon:yes gene_type:complete